MDIEQHLKDRGVNPTAMRLLVFRELEKALHPLSLRELEERMITAERSTIFRTLNLLVKHRLVHAIQDGSGSTKYEICHGRHDCSIDDHHPHFFCVHCQRTFCLHHINIPSLSIPQGFQAHSINLTIQGICPECKDKQTHS